MGVLQTVFPTTSTSALTVTLAATQVGSLIIIGTFTGNGVTNPVSSISDGVHTYTRALQTTAGAVEMWYTICTSSVTSITISFTGNTVSHNACVREYSGVVTASPLDQTAVGNGSTGNLSTAASSATTTANELVVVFGAQPSLVTLSAGSGYTNFQTRLDFTNSYTVAMEDKLITTTGAQTGAITTAANTLWGIGLCTFQMNISPSSSLSGVGSVTGVSTLKL